MISGFSFADVPERGNAEPPPGYVDFCARGAAECRARDDISVIARRGAAWLEIEQVNQTVNHAIKPVSDQEAYGTHEFWTYPTDRGDCEDFVLAKKLKLNALGLSSAALLITIVRDEHDGMHAVLTVVTDQGDFILDNRRAQIRPWNKTHYHFVKRQSRSNPMVWESLEDVPQAGAQDVARYD